MDGPYTYCFGNQMSTMTPKVVMFSMEIAVPGHVSPSESTNASLADSAKLEDMVRELSSALTTVLFTRSVFFAVNESTNSRVVLWAIFEAVVLVAMSFGQIYYLQRFFEVRRVV
ncbi:unnamed protein product [Gongylonema pulchrum]|uniref:GOLD domain-containing protein n=1 Tax=Gongylonema pulchrum TaxID=637853 RepID=A0A183EAJ1_9BILA|nr:unnamed protein product [Gongylonema pulchrum]